MIRSRRLAGAVLVGAALTLGMIPAATAANGAASAKATYIVRMSLDPAVAYRGGIKGLAATKPATGRKLSRNAANVKSYAAYLKKTHDTALAKVGSPRKLYDYVYGLNGFAARLTAAEAAKLAKTAGVVSVEKDAIAKPDTSSTPAFLGLTKAGGLWSKLGGPKHAGRGVVVGVIDTGIWPESRSFSDRDEKGRVVFSKPAGWAGVCQTGEDWDASDCNNKLIGARFYNQGFGADKIAERDFLSPRDYNGHGTHTSSTAAGNYGVQATGDAAAFGAISGMAPHANVAMYKVCWEDAGDGGCANSDSVAAIDDAIADGVDVINFSISGTRTNYLDDVELMFLFAADAGIFVSTSAGNDGPGASTVAHISPWLTATAATTHNRAGDGSVTLGNNAVYAGQSSSAAQVSGQIVRATAVKASTATDNEARLCFLGSLDPAKTAGRIVQCDRGTNARTEKSLAVKEAGGIGMVMTNVTPNSLNADLHFVPTVHVDEVAGAAIKAYIDSAGASATATISKGTIVYNADAPYTAAFSSRGPSLAGGGDILKPDLAAPGVDILAAVAPPGNHGRDFDLLSGTSMSSPHTAGLAALLMARHPDWSPMAVKSALMTTATDVKGATGATLAFQQGAGFVNPNAAENPGLVYDAGWSDWVRFLRGQGLIGGTGGIDASDLNQASIAIGDLAGVQTVTRTVTNVGSATETYTAAVNAPAGIDVQVSPTSFTIAPGAKKTYTVTFTRTDATLDQYTAGSLTWKSTNKAHQVRSPLVIRPVAIAAPAEVHGADAAGSTSWTVKTGYTGSLVVNARGAVIDTTSAGEVSDDPTNNFNTDDPEGNQGIEVHDVVVPAGTSYARFSTFAEEVEGASTDIDMYVYRVDPTKLTLVGISGTGTSSEEVSLSSPSAATYKVFIHGWQTQNPTATYTLHTWVLGTADAGNLTATTDGSVTTGGQETVNLSWSGLTSGKWLGSLIYNDGSSNIGRTIVRIDVP